MSIPVFGKEDYLLDKEAGLSYDVLTIYHERPQHTHSYYEFFIVSDGTALHMVNDSVQTIKKGDLFFIRPSDAHSYAFHHSENFKFHNLGFTKQIFQNITVFLEQPEKMCALTEAKFPPFLHLEEDEKNKVILAMDTVGSLLEKGEKSHARYHAQCLLALFFEDYFFQYEKKQSAKNTQPWLSHLLTEMRKLENFQIGYKKMCNLAPCSPNHLGRILKQQYGITPTEFINEQRLNYALYLLKQTDMEILIICETCGFMNLSHFYHLFKEHFGKSPAKFRKN